MSSNDNKFNTLVLSGEAINGVITLGSLQFFYDKKLLNNINTYIGTSSGTMCGFLLAIGYTPVEIIIYLHENDVFNSICNMSFITLFKHNGLINFSKIYKCIENMTILKLGYLPTMYQLYKNHNKKLIVTTYNLTKQKTEYIDYKSHPDLSCITAIQMSSSIPIIFSNCKYNDNIYIDGAFTNNFPVNMIETKQYKNALCICINNNSKKNIHGGFFQKCITALNNFIFMNTQLRIYNCNVYIQKNIYKIKNDNILDDSCSMDTFRKYDKLSFFSNGYNQAKQIFNLKNNK
jgi:predicted acylesterase/phospholipase RssA